MKEFSLQHLDEAGAHAEFSCSSPVYPTCTPKFRHDVLDDVKHSIRLIQFENPSPDGTLRFSLQHHHFSPSLVYNALSYEWGAPEGQRTVFVNDLPLTVYANLHLFLAQLQQHGLCETSVFVDAMCIAQDNTTERNGQVQMMGRIYEQAETVLVWLGQAADDSEHIFDICDILQHSVDDENDNQDIFKKFPELKSSKTTKPFNSLLLRTYWSRLWILQEIFIARDVILFCGTRAASWSSFKRLPDAMPATLGRRDVWIEQNCTRPAWTHFVQIFKELQCRPQTNVRRDRSFVENVVQFRFAKCFDVRDKVYGLFGLMSNLLEANDEEQGIVVDYDIPPEVLFLRLMRTMQRRIHKPDEPSNLWGSNMIFRSCIPRVK